MKTIDDIVWHDGVLYGISLAFSDRKRMLQNMTVEVYVYPDSDDATKRVYHKLVFKEVNTISINCDLAELKDNIGAGNISNGYAKKCKNGGCFRLYLIDGYIEVTYKKAMLQRELK